MKNLIHVSCGAALMLGMATVGYPAANDNEVALELKLPRPMFVGTPTTVTLPHLEAPRTGPRPKFMVPKGAKKNLAKGKAVTGSDDYPFVGELEMLTDGDKQGSEGSFIELGPGLQYMQVDLGEPCEIYAVLLWHYHAQPRVYHDVVVQVSDDEEFLDGVQTLFNNDHDNSAGLGVGSDKAYVETNEGRLIDAKGVKARYVRCYSKGSTDNDMNHYIEVEVYGRPAP
jgi:hypothetical protein